MEEYLQTVTILKDELFSFEIVKINLELSQIDLVDLTIFEKFIIKIIDKAKEENIPLVEIFEDNKEVKYQKIAEILALDENIVSNNIDTLFSLNLLKIEDNELLVNWNNNLKNWKKEIPKYENESIFLEKENEFLDANKDKKQEFITTLFPNVKDIQIVSNTIEKIEFTIKAILDNGEIKVLFKKDNEYFTFSNDISKTDKLEKLTDKKITTFIK